MAHLPHPYVIAIVAGCNAAKRGKEVFLFASTSIRESLSPEFQQLPVYLYCLRAYIVYVQFRRL